MKKLLFVGLCVLLMANYAAAVDYSNLAIESAPIEMATQSSFAVQFPLDTFVQQFRVTTAGYYLDIRIIDCCIAGDLWSIRALNMNGGVQDVRGTTNGITPGPSGDPSGGAYDLPVPTSGWWDHGGAGRAWLSKVGGQVMDVLIEVRATRSNAISPSSAFMRVKSNADVTITALTANSSTLTLPIAPLPLPSQ